MQPPDHHQSDGRRREPPDSVDGGRNHGDLAKIQRKTFDPRSNLLIFEILGCSSVSLQIFLSFYATIARK
ncbi:hypothetical protein ES319_A09G156200v1 [Gossypium barbadense]|uniref:Uncharacterized protein n=1 Tax=Gossypium barbadense TaxID=3634 RepID=A0A5J5UFX7_GOSBA|nr:hypothetical protein ES319_A09G156200v1 [Gossypium barbadense]